MLFKRKVKCALGMMVVAGMLVSAISVLPVSAKEKVARESVSTRAEAIAEKVGESIEAEDVDYIICVNRVANCVTVYQTENPAVLDETAFPVKSFTCSCGKELEDTPLGVFKTSDYYDWRLMFDGSYGQYAIRFNGPILFHSVPYYSASPDDLEWEEFNKLGTAASMGCVRLATEDVKWLYENCKKGTLVIVYDDAQNPGPLGKPEQVKIDSTSPYRGWDPTDDRVENPWWLFQPELYVREDIGNGLIYVHTGATLADVKECVGLKTRNGIPFASTDFEIKMSGEYDLTAEGRYEVKITSLDNIGNITQKEFVLAVLKPY